MHINHLSVEYLVHNQAETYDFITYLDVNLDQLSKSLIDRFYNTKLNHD